MTLKISQIIKNRFSYKDILDADPKLDYEMLAELVNKWIKDGLIAPIKKSGTTSFKPSIYHEYKKLQVKIDYSMYIKEIKTLHPKLNINRYLKEPEKYADQIRQVLLLSDYFWNGQAYMHKQMSMNEKSFIIWGDEKYLSSSAGHELLKFNQLKAEDLNYYETPEPFFTSICDWDFKYKNVLIIENKDPWYSLTKVLKTMRTNTVCGKEFGLLIFGEGNKATREGALMDFLGDYVSMEADIYYMGDIDKAGIDIFERVIVKNKALKIHPFVSIYKEMLKKAENLDMKHTDDHREICIGEDFLKNFLKFFNDNEKVKILEILSEGKRIPQEIISYPDYQALCGVERITERML